MAYGSYSGGGGTSSGSYSAASKSSKAGGGGTSSGSYSAASKSSSKSSSSSSKSSSKSSSAGGGGTSSGSYSAASKGTSGGTTSSKSSGSSGNTSGGGTKSSSAGGGGTSSGSYSAAAKGTTSTAKSSGQAGGGGTSSGSYTAASKAASPKSTTSSYAGGGGTSSGSYTAATKGTTSTTSKGTDTGRYGGGTTGTTGKGFGGATASKYGGVTSSVADTGRYGGGTTGTTGKGFGGATADRYGGTTTATDTGRYGGTTAGTTGKGFGGSASKYSDSTVSGSPNSPEGSASRAGGAGTSSGSYTAAIGGTTSDSTVSDTSGGAGNLSADRTRMSGVEYGAAAPATGYTPDVDRTRMDSVWGANAPVPSSIGEFTSDAAARTALSSADQQAAIASRIDAGFATPSLAEDRTTRERAESTGQLAEDRATREQTTVAERMGIPTTDPTGFGAALQAGISNDYNAAQALSAQQEVSNPLAQQARAAENQSMTDLDRMTMEQGLATYGPLANPATSPLEAGRLNIGGKYGQTGTIGKVVDAIMSIETRGSKDPTVAQNPDSTAYGPAQFTKGTWSDMIDKYRPDLAGLPEDEKQALRSDPALAAEMTYNYALENGRTLKAAGVDVTASSLYAGHLLGGDTAAKAYQADPNASAVSVLGQRAVNSNKNVMQGKSIGQVLGWVDDQMTAALNAPASETPVPTEAPETSTDIPAPATETTPAPATTGGKKAGVATGPWGVAPEGPIAGQKYPMEPMTTVQQVGGIATKIGLGVFGGIPGAVATGIDVLAELLTGRGFIDRAWASTDNPQSSAGKTTTSEGRPGGGPTNGNGASGNNPKQCQWGVDQDGNCLPDPNATTSTAAAATTAAAETFESKYIEDTGRPTPEQKWDWQSSKYLGVV